MSHLLLSRAWRSIAAVSSAFALALSALAQPVSFTGATYTQDFQSMTATTLAPAAVATTTMLEVSAQTGGGASSTGWYLYHQSAGTPRWGRSNGGVNTGSVYAMFDAAGTPDRALGSLSSASTVYEWGVVLVNSSASTINSVSITYDAVINRNPTTTVNSYPMSYRVSGTNVLAGSGTGDGTFNDAAGTWLGATGFSTPSSGTGGPNLTQAAITPLFLIGGASIVQSLSGLGWDPGEYLYIRWKDTDEGGLDAMAGVDDFSITAISPPNIIVNTGSFNGAFGNVIVGNSSASSSYTVAGTDLTAPLIVTPPAGGFEIRESPAAFSTSAINLGMGNTGTRTIDVRFTPTGPGLQGGDVSNASSPATTQLVPVSGTGIAVTPPTQLVVTSLNGGNNVIESTPFSITVQAQDGANVPQNVLANTDVQVIINTGSGPLGGTTTATILANTNSITISGITYGTPETGVVLDVQRTNGDVLTDGTTGPFDVLGAAQDLNFANVPVSGITAVNVAAFDVEALRADVTVATEYTGAVTIAVFSGPGSISGTTVQNAVNGVATFNDISFSAPGNYILSATASGLNGANSTTIVITDQPALSEVILPQYAINGNTAGHRLPYVCRLTVSNLVPNSTYRYFTGASTNPALGLATPAGNFFVINNGSGANGHITGQTSAKGMNGLLMSGDEFTTNTRYGEFVTDGSGSYTGWFSMVPTGNAVFADGNSVYFYLDLNNGFGGTTVTTAVRSTNTITMIAPTTTGRAARGSSSAAAENMIFLYNNTAGTGRPLWGTWAENDGITTNYTTWYTANVDGQNGRWGAYLPTALATGVRRIEQRDVATAAVLNCPGLSNNGTWAGAGNTVNPTAGTTPIVFTTGDANFDAPQTWYEDTDSDGLGDPAVSQVACEPPGGYVLDNTDPCPNLANIEPGDACDDGDDETVLDVYGTSPTCGCAGTPCTTDLNLIFNPDGVTNIQWELRQQGSNIVVQSGGGVYPLVTEYSVETCLPDGDFYLVVTSDQVGGGIVQGGVLGGYRLETDAGVRLIDNRNNYLSGATSAIAGGEGFTLPVGADRVIYTSCDKVDWRTGEYIVANDNPTISALWPSGGDDSSLSNDGYEMWFYNPNGGYSFRRFHSHATSDGFAPANAQRACHIKINNWSAVNHIPTGVLMNVKVRGRVDNSNLDWGAACRFKLDPTRAECPLTHLMDVPGSTQLSCGGTRAIGSGGANLVHARPVNRYLNGVSTPANRYKFRFRIEAEFVDFTKISNTGQYWVNTIGLAPCKTYLVEVSASFNNGATYCDTYAAANPYAPLWGRTCFFSTSGCPNPEGNGGDQNMAVDGSTGSPRQMVLYPNPNNGEQLFLSMDMVKEGVDKVSVDIFDTFGQRVNTSTIAVNDGFVNTTLDLNGGLAAGMYIVNITAGDVTYTERLVVQP